MANRHLLCRIALGHGSAATGAADGFAIRGIGSPTHPAKFSK